MKTVQEIAQWVIDNRYPKSENNKVSDSEMYYTLVESIEKLCTIPRVIKSVCIAPKGECDRKPEDVCKECEGCKYLEQTVL